MAKKKTNKFFQKYGALLIIVGLLVVFLIVMLTVGTGSKSNKESTEGQVTSMAASEWIEQSKGDDVMVTVFAQTTCSYCEQYKPIVTEVIGEEKVDIYWFDLDTLGEDDYNSLVEAYSDLSGQGTPYTLITQSGKKIGEISGYVEKESLVSKLQEVGAIK